MIAKAGLGLVGLGAIGVGGAALAKPSWFGMGEDLMPECHYLSEDKGFSDSSDYEADTFGKKYGRYLVGVTNKKNADNAQPEKDNKAWWDWAYRRLGNKDTRPEKFKSVSQGYDINSNSKALNQVCKEAYKVTDSSGFGTNENQFKKSDVWKYCSLGTLVDISGDGYTNEQVGGQTENKKVFVSVESSDNDWFWKIRNEDFWAQEGEWSGSKATGNKTDSSFKNEYDDNNGDAGTKENIKKICENVYESNNSVAGGNNKNAEHARKFCALELPAAAS